MEPDAATTEKRASASESTLSPALRKFQKQGAMVARLSTLQSASAAAACMDAKLILRHQGDRPSAPRVIEFGVSVKKSWTTIATARDRCRNPRAIR